MKRLIARATSSRLQMWIAGVSLVTWIVLSPITLETGLRSSLVWITTASLFANVATCFGWWVTSLVNVKAERIDNRTEQGRHFQMIEESEQRVAAMLDEGHKRIAQKIDVVIDLLIDEPKPKPEAPGAIRRD